MKLDLPAAHESLCRSVWVAFDSDAAVALVSARNGDGVQFCIIPSDTAKLFAAACLIMGTPFSLLVNLSLETMRNSTDAKCPSAGG